MEKKPPKIFFRTNLKFLRERKRISQELLAEKLGITRVKLAALETGQIKSPRLEDFLNVSSFFKMSIDTLLKIDLRTLSEFKLQKLEAGNDTYLQGGKIRVLAISTNNEGTENVEYVPAKAKMGYRAGFADPEYIAALPKYTIPNLPHQKTYRIFPSVGESMLPLKPGTDFITEYVEDWSALKNTPCVVILKSAGPDFVFKMVTYLADQKEFMLVSLNEAEFKPYRVPVEEVLEVWKYYKHITDEFPEPTERRLNNLTQMVKEIREKVMK